MNEYARRSKIHASFSKNGKHIDLDLSIAEMGLELGSIQGEEHYGSATDAVSVSISNKMKS